MKAELKLLFLISAAERKKNMRSSESLWEFHVVEHADLIDDPKASDCKYVCVEECVSCFMQLWGLGVGGQGRLILPSAC